ncbi:hypothetical protein J1N35_018901 [Gossypium stocksii]|uniref:Uncharacterized protein n=1 Tax=Gossypium stocksii TaxID=47602 RepID=A0A9D4A6L4_9ROSI|nr:hypothetical protein J1N35_018901 [Gossypium stocksii]
MLPFGSGRIRIVAFGIYISWRQVIIKGGHGRVSTGSALAVFTPKFKRRRVSAITDFLPGCRRVTASNYGGGAQDYLVLYVIRCVTIYTALIVNQLKAEGWAFGHMGEGWAFGHMGVQTRM